MNERENKKDRTKGPQNTYFCGLSTKDIVRFVIKEFIPAREIKEVRRDGRNGEVGPGGSTNGSDTHPLMPRVTSLFARFSRGLVGRAFNLELHLAVTLHLRDPFPRITWSTIQTVINCAGAALIVPIVVKVKMRMSDCVSCFFVSRLVSR